MAGMAQTLTKEDIEQLAEYYSKQTPALETLPKRSFFFSAK
jgi:cytochrome c553